jgi:hypothetical protein
MDQRATSAHMPFWKRGLLITTLLLCTGPFAAVPCFASPSGHGHFHFTNAATCVAGDGGDGGVAINRSTGGGGGAGGDCVFAGGAKGGGGGTILNGAGPNKANGGNVILPSHH